MLRLTERIEATSRETAQTLQALRNHKGQVGTIGAHQVVGGMRGLPAMLCLTSNLHAEAGICYRQVPLETCLRTLPKHGEFCATEALLWFLLTGEQPTLADVDGLTQELNRYAELPADIAQVIRRLPTSMHPMTQLIVGLALLEEGSIFKRQYEEGLPKTQLWKVCLQDTFRLLGYLPALAALIYHGGANCPPQDLSLDWAARLAQSLLPGRRNFQEFLRMYMFIHCDHEAGNVSAHATHLVGSALSDPYLACIAGVSGLAGPLHGRACQESLEWTQKLAQSVKADTPAEVSRYVTGELQAKRLIPGYGHAVLRKTDPRFTIQQGFARQHLGQDRLVNLVGISSQVIPPLLEGKVSNPYPNVDAHSGVILFHYGLKSPEFYTVLFSLSRMVGVLSQLTLSRFHQLPIERPKSVTPEDLWKMARQKSKL